jgi:hypothetical protein
MARVRFPESALLLQLVGFEPWLIHWCFGCSSKASLAQMVERKTLNLVVAGSIPAGGAF